MDGSTDVRSVYLISEIAITDIVGEIDRQAST